MQACDSGHAFLRTCWPKSCAGLACLGLSRGGCLLTDDLDEDSLAAAAVKLAVEDLFPRAEVELAARDGDGDLSAHDLALQVGIAVVFAGLVVAVLLDGCVGGPASPATVRSRCAGRARRR